MAIVYIDQITTEDGVPINRTPAAAYSQTDLSTILDRISDGTIVCGTGEIYPVNWSGPSDKDLPPWSENGPNGNPWKTY